MHISVDLENQEGSRSFDTLLDKHSTEEIVSVVAHEIGHYKKRHIITGTFLGIIETGIMLFIFNIFMNDLEFFMFFRLKKLLFTVD